MLAAAAGRVSYVGFEKGGFGRVIEVRHPSGWTTLYAHNARVLKAVGDWVRFNEPIAAGGSTGRSTGPHLHFEVRDSANRPHDPEAFLKLPTRSPGPARRPSRRSPA